MTGWLGARGSRGGATKRALVRAARALFAQQGFAATSLDGIVAEARVTKGALYHHFRGKQELFDAVVGAIEEDAVERVRARLDGVTDPYERALVGLREFLDVARQEEYRRLVVQEGPAVLGAERFRARQQGTTFALVEQVVSGLLDGYELSPTMTAAFTRLFLGTVEAAGASVALAEDPDQASDEAEWAMVLVLAGLRSLVESGAELPSPADLVKRPGGS